MANFLSSKKGKKILGAFYALGAAVVIIGAWAKILHLAIADIMLTVGLLTEAAIFIISAFEPVHEEYNWSLVYPELAGGAAKDKKAPGKTATQQLDEMMEKAKIGPDLIQSLTNGFTSLNKNVSEMSKLTDAAVATDEYAKNVKVASTSVSTFGKNALEAANAVGGMSLASNEAKQYHEQVQSLVKNMSSLNAIYELELQDSNNHLKSMNKFYGNISNALQSLADATEDSKRYKDEMAKLSKNLTALNAIYGNMLSAMAAPRV